MISFTLILSLREKITSAVRAFDPGYFCYSASVLEPRHIRVRPKGVTFGLGC